MNMTHFRYIRIGDVKRWRVVSHEDRFWGEYSYYEFKDWRDSPHPDFQPIKEREPFIISSNYSAPIDKFNNQKEVEKMIGTLISDYEVEISKPKIVKEWSV